MKTIGSLVVMGMLVVATVGCSGGGAPTNSTTAAPNATTASPAAK